MVSRTNGWKVRLPIQALDELTRLLCCDGQAVITFIAQPAADTGRLSVLAGEAGVSRWVSAQERQEFGVYLVLMRSREAMGSAGVVDVLRALDDSRRFPRGVVNRHDLIVLAM